MMLSIIMMVVGEEMANMKLTNRNYVFIVLDDQQHAGEKTMRCQQRMCWSSLVK